MSSQPREEPALARPPDQGVWPPGLQDAPSLLRRPDPVPGQQPWQTKVVGAGHDSLEPKAVPSSATFLEKTWRFFSHK